MGGINRMKKKRIMVIAEKYDGGVKTHLEIITNNIKEFDVFQLILNGELNPPSLNNEDARNIFLKDFSITNPIKLYKRIGLIKRILVDRDIDLIHLHSTVAGITGILLAGLLWNRRVKFLYTPHAYYSQKPSLGYLKKLVVLQIEKLICRYPSKIIHVSKGEEKHALVNKIVRDQKSVVIYNGIKKRVKVESAPSKSFVIGNLARVDFQKNPERFFEIATYIIRNSKMQIKFVFGGDGPLLEEMRSLVSKRELQGKIEFIGYVDDIDAFFNQIDAYLSTSYYEGLPYSVVEAASFGIPLFLSDVIGHNEMIYGNGILYNLNASNEEIGETLIKILERDDLVEEQGKESFRMFERLFEEKKMIERLNNLYSLELNSI